MPVGPTTFDARIEQDHVLLIVQSANMTKVTVTRNGELVRGAFEASPTGPSLWVGVDWEAPQGRVLDYVATVTDGVDTDTATSIPFGEMDYGGDYIMPILRPELGMNITVEWGGIGALEHPTTRSTAYVVNRPDPVAVSWGRKMWNGQLTFLTLNDGDRRRFLEVIDYPVVMFAARPGFGFDDSVFLSLGSVIEERTYGLGSEESRRWIVEAQQVNRPPAELVLPPPSVSWDDVRNSGDTWQDLLDSGKDWFAVAGWGQP